MVAFIISNLFLIFMASDVEKAYFEEQKQKKLEAMVEFPGSVAEYELLRGYAPGSVVPFDTGQIDKGVFFRVHYSEGRVVNNFDTALRDRMIDEGVEALVNAIPTRYSQDLYTARYGLPVKQKEQWTKE